MTSATILRFAAVALLTLCSTPFSAVRAQEEEEEGEPELDDEVRQPAPPPIGADVPLAYFGPPPLSVDKRLVGPVQLLTAGQIDEDAGTIQRPLLYTGYYTTVDGEDPDPVRCRSTVSTARHLLFILVRFLWCCSMVVLTSTDCSTGSWSEEF